ncbi:MAG: glycerophosphodiester phosphodiesterase family protein, partial [Clostridia bacterium]
MTKKLNKGAKVTLIVLASIIAIWGIIALLPRPKNYPSDNTFLRGDKLPLLIAHGGGNMEFPDNTIEAFYNAYSVDSNAMMETDVSITKDNIVLLSHDTSLDRKTNISGKIKDLNYSDLMKNEVDFNYENPVVSDDDGTGNNLNGERARYKNGEGKYVLPTDVSYPAGVSARHQTKFLATTLEDLIRAFPTNKINVEIKQAGDVGLLALQKTIELLNKLEGEGIHALSNVVVASFHDEVYDKMVEIQKKEIPTLMYSPAINCVVKYVLLSYTLMD